MPRVYSRKSTYDYDQLKPTICEIMDAAGGGAIGSGSRVLVKPNLLAPATPDKAMLTHPLVVRAVVEYLLKKGARVQVSDSQAMGSFEKVMKESGLEDALSDLDVDCRELKASLSVEVGEPFHRLEVSEDALKADFLINLPKLKTHSQMLLTLGVKNLFGCVVGLRKPEWHLRTGVDRQMFARLIVSVCKAVRPSITILDGILAMEGQGPGKGGVPRHVGVVLGSSSAVAVDIAVCRMLGIAQDRLLTNEAARELGLIEGDVEIEGDFVPVPQFDIPEITPIVFGPHCFHGLMRKHLVQRPVPDTSLCKLCGDCWRYCPAHAITHDRKQIIFDYDKCIRCYCCLEVCPHGALKAEEPFMGKIFTKIIKRSSRHT